MTERTSRLETLIAGFVTQLGGKGRVSASQFANVKSAASLTLQVDELDAKLARGPHSREDSALYAKLVVERQAMFVAAGLTTTNANQPTDRQDEGARAALSRIVDGIKADHKRKEVARLAAAKPEPLQMLDGEDFTDVLLRRLADFGVFIPDGAPLDGQVVAPRPRLVEARPDPGITIPVITNQDLRRQVEPEPVHLTPEEIEKRENAQKLNAWLYGENPSDVTGFGGIGKACRDGRDDR
jgi:hypothetical protein